jgi:hypothetical protein
MMTSMEIVRPSSFLRMSGAGLASSIATTSSTVNTGTGPGIEAVRLNLRQSVQRHYLGAASGGEYELFERAQRKLQKRKTPEVRD